MFINKFDQVYIKEQLIKLFEKKEWLDELNNLAPGVVSKIELMWATTELVKEGKLKEGSKIATYYQFDPDPSENDDYDRSVRAGKEERTIYTVRGALSWLLQAIVGQLDPAYYNDVLDILEGTQTDSIEEKKLRLATGNNLYVRMQATYPLSLLAANLFAKQNADGTAFDIGERNRTRIKALVFRMLRENKDYPRVMEYVARIFDRYRLLSNAEAQEVLETLFYNSKTHELQPEYILREVAPLAIFFAEFRKDLQFDNAWFKDFLKRVIKENNDSLSGTIIWHFWKTCEDEPNNFDRFKVYIPLFFEGQFKIEITHQLEFLIEKIADKFPKEAIELFTKLIIYINNGLRTEDPKSLWLLSSEEIIKKIAENKPDELVSAIDSLIKISLRGTYVGDLRQIFESYKFASQDKQPELKAALQKIYNEAKRNESRIVDITW